MLASERWLICFRNSLLTAVFPAVALLTRPDHFMGNAKRNRIVTALGSFIVLAGQAFHLFVIGFN